MSDFLPPSDLYVIVSGLIGFFGLVVYFDWRQARRREAGRDG